MTSTTTDKTIDNKGQKPVSNSDNNKEKESPNNESIVSLKEASVLDYDR